MKISYKDPRFSRTSLARIDKVNEIIDEYLAMGLRLTLRQLYYQLVSRTVIPNREREYKNLSHLVSEARLAGRVDWDAIEDRVRMPRSPSEFENLQQLIDAAIASYRLPRWRGQEHYVELWVEKDALAGVLEPLAREFHVTMMVNRGYSSQTAMKDSADRFRAAVEEGLDPVLFYLGDHDPSGEDMVRDIDARLELLRGGHVHVKKLALTMAQVRHFNPPPNPAKMSDPRAEGYVAAHGDESWEVDAIPPDELARIVQRAFHSVVDKEAMDRIKHQEEADKKRLRKATKKLR